MCGSCSCNLGFTTIVFLNGFKYIYKFHLQALAFIERTLIECENGYQMKIGGNCEVKTNLGQQALSMVTRRHDNKQNVGERSQRVHDSARECEGNSIYFDVAQKLRSSKKCYGLE